MTSDTKLLVAIHILLAIDFFKNDKATSSLIAKNVGVNPAQVRRFVGILKECGFINTTPGVGGMSLAKSPSKISLYDIFVALDEPNLFKIHSNLEPRCSLASKIENLLSSHYDKIDRNFTDELKSVSLQNLLDDLGEMSDN